MASDSDVELHTVTTDELIDELSLRHRTLVVLGTPTSGKPSAYVLRRRGSLPEMLGMLDIAMRLTRRETATLTPIDREQS